MAGKKWNDHGPTVWLMMAAILGIVIMAMVFLARVSFHYPHARMH